VADLDPVIHAQARLRITSALATLDTGESISFPRLQEILDMTAGNLSTHLRRLEDAGYIVVTKTHSGKTPVTYLELSKNGRRAFEDYTESLRSLLGKAT
jgi:DNA-binding MarR family transcriptional regulator